jgi:branched-chain amino acid aminotransferase
VPGAYCYVNGEIVSAKDAVVSVFDHGFVTGDGAFETVAIYDDRAFELDRHLRRLRRTLGGLGISDAKVAGLDEAARALIERNAVGTGKLRITYTAGNAGLGSGRVGGEPTVVMAIEPTTFTPRSVTRVAVAPWPRSERGALTGLKTTSYAENVMGLAFAESKGASEVIFPNLEGNICEGSGSNIFLVVDGAVVTPPLTSGCLAGITREVLIERAGVQERDLPIDALFDGTVTEAFLTSSLREIQAISHVDDVPLKETFSPLVEEMLGHFGSAKEQY